MNGALVFLVIGAVLLVALGLQVLSRQIQRFPVDQRRADPLIDVAVTRSTNVRPAELHQLILIVSNALLSDAAARSELQPILDDLGAAPQAGATTPSRPVVGRGRRRTGRSSQLAAVLDQLEDRWA